jgi:hypothetical protein
LATFYILTLADQIRNSESQKKRTIIKSQEGREIICFFLFFQVVTLEKKEMVFNYSLIILNCSFVLQVEKSREKLFTFPNVTNFHAKKQIKTGTISPFYFHRSCKRMTQSSQKKKKNDRTKYSIFFYNFLRQFVVSKERNNEKKGAPPERFPSHQT